MRTADWNSPALKVSEGPTFGCVNQLIGPHSIIPHMIPQANIMVVENGLLVLYPRRVVPSQAFHCFARVVGCGCSTQK